MSPISRRSPAVEEKRNMLRKRGKDHSEQTKNLKNESSGSEKAPRPRSGRMGKPKTRTGCITCKIRRIKCDEGKPACMRCTLTGRDCDGYRQPPQPKGTSSLPLQVANLRPATAALQLHLIIKFNHRLPPHLVEYPDQALGEHRALEYFRCYTAAVLGNWVVENFWKYQLPQTASSEPATRHAMIALAKLHENVEIQREGIPNDPRLSPEAVDSRLHSSRYHYNIAVSELARALSERTDSEEVALMVCALFVIYNFISGNFSAAIFHMHNGIEIMTRWKTFKIGTRVLPEGSLERNLIRLFGRLSHKSLPLDVIPTRPEQDDAEFIPFPNLQSARTSLDNLTREQLRLVRIGAVLAHNPQSLESWGDLDLQASTFFISLSRWLSEFDSLVASLPIPHSREDKTTIYLLRIMHISSHIWIWVGLTPPDAEEPTSMIERFLDLVEDMHGKWANGTLHCPGLHIFDMEIIPPINFIARKSRNQVFRDRAKELLIKAAPLIIMNTHTVPVPGIGTLSLGEEQVERGINLEGAMAEIGENGTVEVEVRPGATQIGISLKPKRSGDGWEVRKDFAV